ncbi:ribosome hibernation-promoting factor, HPF/YfiA family [Peptoniphilus catoniae]|uniref:ribosome hibernation-promoting factor, HPF/YfiA family n=1 Tax=Peptoniphilus catoniae TaxID=1660341 RepID=UPI0010FE3084|nr:ribosome-associated translation inhibitor RaiA [Peptoniphilus catoniae]
MLLDLVGKNIELTDGLKDYARSKFSKIDKYFDKEIKARAVFSTVKNDQTVEVTIFLPGTILRAEETTEDMYTSIDKAIDALSRQTRKYKTRLKKRYQGNSETIRFENINPVEDEVSGGKEAKIVKRKTFSLVPMHEEEALLQMELLNHNFFVFLNADTDKVEIAYKRKDKDYGVIEVLVED